MYLFLTVWFGLCGVLLGSVLIYMAVGRGAGLRLHKVDPKLSGGYLNRTQIEEQSERRENTRELADNIGGGRGRLAVWGLLSGCLLLCLLYAIHALGSPVSAQGTLNEMLRSGFYTSFVIFALLAARTRRGGALLAAVWHLLGITISLSALLAVCGGLPVPYAVAYTESPGVSATGARLAGLLQYPNAFGAVMAVYLLERLFAAAYSFRREDSQGGAGISAVRASVGGAGEVGVETAGAGNNSVRASVSGEGEVGTEGVNAGNNWVCAGVGGVDESVAETAGAGNNVVRSGVSGVGESGESGAGDAGSSAKLTRTWSASHWLRAARLLPLFPYAAALLLSESRGAWLAAAAASAAALLLKRQLFVPLLITGAAPVAAAALLYRQLARSGLAAEPPARPAAAGRALGRRVAGRPMAAPPQLPCGGQGPRRRAGTGGGGLDGGGQRRPAAGTRADHRAVTDGRRARAVLPRRLEARGRSALAGARGRDLAACVPCRPVPPLRRQPGAQRLPRHPPEPRDGGSGCAPPAAPGRRRAGIQGVTKAASALACDRAA